MCSLNHLKKTTFFQLYLLRATKILHMVLYAIIVCHYNYAIILFESCKGLHINLYMSALCIAWPLGEEIKLWNLSKNKILYPRVWSWYVQRKVQIL